MSTPLVSVVIPTYNREAYLRIALDSAVNQTLRDIEIVVQDNHSDYDIAALIARYGDDRIKLEQNPRNLGQTQNIIRGLQRTRGKYVAILGDDDFWKPEFLLAMTSPMERNDHISVAFSDVYIVDSDGAINVKLTEYIHRFFCRHLVGNGLCNDPQLVTLIYRAVAIMSGCVLRRDSLDIELLQPQPILDVALDIYIGYLAVRGGGECYHVPERLVYYRYHPGQMVHRRVRSNPIEAAKLASVLWQEIASDRRIKHRLYFRMWCTRKAVKVIYYSLRSHQWREAWEAVKSSLTSGLFGPVVMSGYIYYLAYFWLHRVPRWTP